MTAKCFVVMSGGVDADLMPYDHVKDRCDHVAAEWRSGDFIIFSSIFTLNKPQRFDARGFVISEAAQTQRYFAKVYGVDCANVFLENSSFDTIGSIYFSLRLILNLDLRPCEIIFVTSSFHARRTRVILSNIATLFEINVATRVETPSTERQVNSSSREKHEDRQLKRFEALFSGFSRPKDFYHWLYSRHDNYSVLFSSNAIGDGNLY